MIIDIEKIIESVKQDPRTAYLDHLGKAIENLASKNSTDTGSAYFSSESDHSLRMKMIEKLHNSAMEVINTLEK